LDDITSLNQVLLILGNHAITIIHPEGLNLNQYKNLGFETFLTFPKEYFLGISGYNKLMLSKTFYESFNKKYILIYQTDCYIFRDELLYWCNKNYDYIGAPWLRSNKKNPILKKIWDYNIYYFLTLINYKENYKWQKNKSLLYNMVGNGGLSLRKREKFIDILIKLKDVIEVYLKPENESQFYAEDVFFSIEPKRNKLKFSIADYKTACGFSVESKPEKAISINHNKLPFGCHRWNKESYDFWKKYIK
jgi:hypothetical protein